jgi:hypothetical protein
MVSTLVAAVIVCQAQFNFQKVWSQSMSVSQGQRALVGEVEEFRVYLRSESGSSYQIEIFDPKIPARYYAGGKIASGEQSPLKWTYWERDRMVEVDCRAE